MTRLADISVAIQEGAVGLLTTTEMRAALGEASDAGVVARIWDSPPPPDATLPYVMLSMTEPVVTGPVGTTELFVTTELTVKVVGRVDSYEGVSPVAIAIHHALQGKVSIPLNGGGWWYSSRRLRVISYPEVNEGVEYRHLGGTYEVVAQ